MTKQEFLEKYNNAPYALYEIAELLSDIIDDEKIAKVAKVFLSAKENLEMVLNEIGFEFG